MQCMREKFYIAALIFCAPHFVAADSLLTPTHFPKTFDDVGFSERYDVLAADYERFADLTPYEQLEIIETDAGINDEIAAYAQENDTQIDSGPIIIDVDTSNNDAGNNDTQIQSRYCAVQNSGIPVGQKIPIGKPVYESDFTVCSKYGWRKISGKSDFHYGFDIGCTNAHKGRPVFAIADGVVETVKPNGRGSSAGNYISINHGNGWVTKYMHLRDMLVRRGERVQAGCQIATIGNTGGAKANRESFKNNPYPKMSENAYHLHYEIHYTGKNTAVTADGRTIPIVHKPGHNSVDPAPFMGIGSKYFYKP